MINTFIIFEYYIYMKMFGDIVVSDIISKNIKFLKINLKSINVK